jgi:hypothetical protein
MPSFGPSAKFPAQDEAQLKNISRVSSSHWCSVAAPFSQCAVYKKDDQRNRSAKFGEPLFLPTNFKMRIYEALCRAGMTTARR